MIDAVRSGDANMAIVSAAALGDLLPDLLAFDLPFLFPDTASARSALDGDPGRYLLDRLQGQGLIGLAWGETGVLQLTTRTRPVHGPSELAGLSIRVQENPIQRETFSALDARPDSIAALAEVVAALSDGRLDGQATSLWVMPFMRIDAVQLALTLTGHSYQPNNFLLAPAAAARLSSDERAALTAAAQAGVAANRAAVDRADPAALETLRQKGMVVDENPDRTAFRAAVQPVYERWRSRLPPYLVQQLSI